MKGLSLRFRIWWSLLLVTAAAGFIGYWRLYSTAAPYDDEGTLMLSAQRFLDGQIIYDSIRSVYGPLFYTYRWAAIALTGPPLLHDHVRMVTGVFWLACGILAFLLVYRVTGSLLTAAIAHFTIFRALRFLSDEVGHP